MRAACGPVRSGGGPRGRGRRAPVRADAAGPEAAALRSASEAGRLAVLEADRRLPRGRDVALAGRRLGRQVGRELPLAGRHRDRRRGARAGHVVGALDVASPASRTPCVRQLRGARQDRHRRDLDVDVLAAALLGDRLDLDRRRGSARRLIASAAAGEAADATAAAVTRTRRAIGPRPAWFDEIAW